MVNVAGNLIDAPGTPEAAWRAWPGLGQLPALDATGWASAVVVAAHPDDEVLGAGGIIAVLAARGARLRIVALTDGEASHPHRRESIASRRAAETLAALAALGARDAEVIRLGLPGLGARRTRAWRDGTNTGTDRGLRRAPRTVGPGRPSRSRGGGPGRPGHPRRQGHAVVPRVDVALGMAR